MTARRSLKFNNWDEVIQDINSLVDGYSQAGKWTLGQALSHLNDWLTFPMDGFPPAPMHMRAMMSMVRLSMGPRMLRGILAESKMRDGVPTAPVTVYQEEQTQDVAAIAAATLQNIDRFRKHTGPIHRSPIFGDMDKETAEQLQWVHFAHHLSWLVPNRAGAAVAS